MQSGQEIRVSMKEKSSGTIISGEDAPLVSQMQYWLEEHPGYVLIHTLSSSCVLKFIATQAPIFILRWEPVIDNECESIEPEDEATEEDDETEIEHLMT